MDLGSAVLSAEMALEFLDAGCVARRCCSAGAPFVEGAVSAAVAAKLGASSSTAWPHEALGGLAGKTAHLGRRDRRAARRNRAGEPTDRREPRSRLPIVVTSRMGCTPARPQARADGRRRSTPTFACDRDGRPTVA